MEKQLPQGNYIIDPYIEGTWRLAASGEQPDFWSYEAEFVAISPEAKAVAEEL